MDKRILRLKDVLLYYDMPQLISAQDQLGLDYICLLSDTSEIDNKFVCVPISKGKLELLLSGQIDLRGTLETPEINVFYEGITVNGDLTNIIAEEIGLTTLPSEWLPESDLFLDEQNISSNVIVNESSERGRAVILCTLNPPEARTESKITAEHLIEGIGLYQRVIKYAYQKALQSVHQTRSDFREYLFSPKNYELEVFGFSTGSFTIHLQPVASGDLLGYSNISHALKVVDSISNVIDDTQQAFNIISEYGGHFATAYKNLLKYIIEKEIPFSYEWSMPQLKNSISGKILPRYAKPLYEELSKRVEIGIEYKEIIGIFTMLDNSGQWKVFSEDDNKEYKGKSTLDLAGTVFKNRRYILTCEEKLIIDQSTGREFPELTLLSVKEP
jgi:hypothetical protein